MPLNCTLLGSRTRSQLSLRSVLLPSAEVSTGHPHPCVGRVTERDTVFGGYPYRATRGNVVGDTGSVRLCAPYSSPSRLCHLDHKKAGIKYNKNDEKSANFY